MADRTLYMDLNGKLKKGYEHGQKWQFGSLGKEDKYCRSVAEIRRKVAEYKEAHPDYEKFNRLASQRV